MNFSELVAPNGLFSDGDWIEKKDQDENGTVRLIQLADIGACFFKDKFAHCFGYAGLVIEGFANSNS